MSSESIAQQSGQALLIVDDDESFCRALERAMSRRGFVIQMAHCVDEAWRLAQTRPPDYAIVDLNMPGGSGLELVPRLSLLAAGTRILVLSGFASICTAQEAIIWEQRVTLRNRSTRMRSQPLCLTDADVVPAVVA